MAMELDRAGAVGTAELGVVVGYGFSDRFELPERLVATTDFEASSFDLALVNLFGLADIRCSLVVRLCG